jgi:hypothetical protein
MNNVNELYNKVFPLSDDREVTNAIKEQGLAPDGDDYHLSTEVIPSPTGFWWAEVGCAISGRTFARADITYLVAMLNSNQDNPDVRVDFEQRIIQTFVDLIKCVDPRAYEAHYNTVK